MSVRVVGVLVSVGVCVLGTAPVAAQGAAEPKIWTAQASAGFALTSGNKDTSTINLSFDVTYDPRRRNVLKWDGLMIRGKTDGELSADRLGINVRDEYRIDGHAFVFAQHRYLRDRFKDIEYLFAPTGGVGYRLLDTVSTRVAVDVGLGVVWEKNDNPATRSSGALTVGQEFSHALTDTTTLTQTFSGLWKTRDFGDTLFEVGAGIAASISARTQLKVEVLNAFKNKPPATAVQKNDVAVIVGVAYAL